MTEYQDIDDEPYYGGSRSTVEALEDRINDLESELHTIRNSMVTWGGLGWVFLFVVIGFTWDDKIWEFIKSAGLFLMGLIILLIDWLKTVVS